ncbi:phage terminase small subunit [Musicola paradisiaca]|uniref:Small terminase subunit n=1 Tax=Musicola paradisiaca (strain Ech703) TaxID=579405 RepID=C6C5E6_MUSP7|nr:phage terminase small subunit [Musicola paradisiaca]ACS87583.1 small terminase subunit [Musicola paradisiaca Ech703]
MLTPAQRHFQRVMAERRGQEDIETEVSRTAHEQILHRLRLHQAALKQVQSDATKAEMKKAMLPEYDGWIDGTLEGDSGRQDEVIVTLMVWAIDCQDSALALKLGRYVVEHGLSLPADKFRRDAVTVLAEEVSNPVLTLAATDDRADLSGYTAVLDEVAAIVDGKDMPDEVRAKLCKARAFSRRAAVDAQTKADALTLFREAMARNPNAGVKREIATLTRELKKLMPGSSDAPEDGAPGDDETTMETAAGETPPAASADAAQPAVKKAAVRNTTARKTTRPTGKSKAARQSAKR